MSNQDEIKRVINEIKKEIERQTYFAQSLTNDYSKVIKLKSDLKILEEKEKNQTMREYKIFWKSTKRAESKILAGSLNEAKRIAFKVTENEEIWEVDYIENSYDE